MLKYLTSKTKVNAFQERFITIIVTVNLSLGMKKDDLGRTLTHEYVEELEARGIDPCGEGGEFHTTVIDGPIFNHPIPETDYVQNYVQHQGFFPHGWSGVFSALLIVIFSYGGTELIGLTLTETKDAEKVLPSVIKGVIWRIVLFYTLPILIICGLIPRNEIGNQASPFVQVLSAVGFDGAAHIMNFVLITAVLSAANSGIYGCTRMLHSLAAEGEAPKLFSYVSKNGVPLYSVILSSVILIWGTFVAYFSPDRVFGYLMAIPGFTVSLVWISICLAQLKLRKTYTNLPQVKVWGYPYVTSFTAIALSVSCVAFAFSEQNRVSIFVCLGILVILVLSSVFLKKKAV